MQALAAADDATGALAAAERHEAAVRRELEVDPDASVAALAARIRAQTRTMRPAMPPVPAGLQPSMDHQTASVDLPVAPLRPHRRWKRWSGWTAAGLGTLTALLAGAWQFAPVRSAALLTLVLRSDPTLVAQRVAVAPLTNRTGDNGLDAFGEMAADWIAQGLSETGVFDVVDPRTALITARVVARIPGVLRPDDGAVALGRETGAALSVGGSYYRDGDSLRVRVHVVGTESGQVLRLVSPVAGAASDPGALVTVLARLTVAAVAAIVDTTSAGLSASLSPPPSYEAYAATSLAWESFYRSDTADAFRQVRRAVALDSTYAPPLLMQAYLLFQADYWAEMDSTLRLVHTRHVHLTPVESAALHVLEADVAGDLTARLAAAREMTRLAPASTEGATLAAGSALRVGRNVEALSHLSRVDPERGLLLFWPVYWIMSARALHGLDRHRDEAALLRRGLRQFPSAAGLHDLLVKALAAAGDYDGALRAARTPMPGDPFPAQTEANYATVAAGELRGHGHAALAQRLLDSLADHPAQTSADSSQAPYDRRLRGEILYQAGRWAQADSVLRPLQSYFAESLEITGRLATIAARTGRRDEAERVTGELAARPAGYLHGRQTFWRAHIAAALGHREDAVLLLRDAFAAGYPMTDEYYALPHADRDFLELLDDPPFLGVMRRE